MKGARVRLDVLGCAGSQPGGGQACSGYLVSTETTRVLVDCGFGVSSRLTGAMDPAELDGVVVTHRHLDHSIDLLGLFRVLWSSDDVVPVFAAAEVEQALLRMVKDDRRPDWERVFPWTEVGDGDTWAVGDLTFTAAEADHPVPTVSLRVGDAEGAVLAYSSDTGGNESLVEVARDADLFLCEATWQGADPDRRGDGHLTAMRAGALASEAGARHLVLTHLRSHLAPAVSVSEASHVFSGPVAVARDGDSFTLTPRAAPPTSPGE